MSITPSQNSSVAQVPPVTAIPAGHAGTFPDRRQPEAGSRLPALERRQFGNSHHDLSPDARELGQAIDQYKLVHRRRFITYEEMLGVIRSLGYRKQGPDQSAGSKK